MSHHVCANAVKIAQLITAESGKPVKWARIEVTRAVSTFQWAAEEARRWSGHLQRLDTDAGSTGRLALVRRAPRGPILGIAPFNFPLNLMAHKVAPALAVGAPIIVKPAPAAPLSSLVLGELLAETALLHGSWSVLTVTNDRASDMVRDPRLPVVSFTGSVPVGWSIKEMVPRKHVTLELGGNAAVVVCQDWDDEDKHRYAAERIARFSMYQAGQSCISVQRVYVHEVHYASMRKHIVEAVLALGTGAPTEDNTDVGSLIDERAALRVAQWIDDAVAGGANVLTGGMRSGTTVEPTVIEDTPAGARVLDDEIFGPVVVLCSTSSDRESFDRVNVSRFGLQAGVFTADLHTDFRASQLLNVGRVIIGDVPSYRADQMPYGGVKDSGTGKEGVRSAMDDLTDERVLVLTGIDMQ
ncbi:aldehyde dehydrogenase family protein [Rhodococcus sp. 14-2470-1a]|uniref:aldehyde dehydrogenase family protein n=1 Tax=Rhodococcus sp. 14-2470-1a TaxID=2023150 RepID=UPI00211AC148|nr:aldehyde dehydrogenase family protein [Rhodococcus sp. 14-2470-1a]